MLSDFSNWIRAVLEKWQVLVTGGLVTAILVGVQYWREKTFSWDFYKWVLVAFVLSAFFLAWRDQSHATQEADSKRRIAEQKLEDTKPKLDGEFEQGMAFTADGEGKAIIQIEIRNSGGSPTIAEKWLMSVKAPSGQVYKGIPYTAIGGLKSMKLLGPGVPSPEILEHVFAMGLVMDNAAKPIPAGGSVRGWFPAEFPDTSDGHDLTKPGSEWTVGFVDVFGKRYEINFNWTPPQGGYVPEYFPPTN